MKYGKRYKRGLDIMEKLGVASAAIGIFQGRLLGVILGVIFLAVSIIGTKED